MIQIAQTIKDAVYMEKTCPVAPCKGIQERSAERGVAGSNPGRTNTQGLKITEENVLPLLWHLQSVRHSSLLG